MLVVAQVSSMKTSWSGFKLAWSARQIFRATATSGRASYWDALLILTAAEAGCAAILTEDLADGTELAGVRIINPFAGAALSTAAAALLGLE